ncbi:MAG TPA: hypothetical protein VNE40_02780 [Candidatus Dormibacteraeota bacterium]|nr:hypothetical protein [Candidatus Dormibacteraeota bacterium]
MLSTKRKESNMSNHGGDIYKVVHNYPKTTKVIAGLSLAVALAGCNKPPNAHSGSTETHQGSPVSSGIAQPPTPDRSPGTKVSQSTAIGQFGNLCLVLSTDWARPLFNNVASNQISCDHHLLTGDRGGNINAADFWITDEGDSYNGGNLSLSVGTYISTPKELKTYEYFGTTKSLQGYEAIEDSNSHSVEVSLFKASPDGNYETLDTSFEAKNTGLASINNSMKELEDYVINAAGAAFDSFG